MKQGVVAALLASCLAACGGGGSTSSTSTASGNRLITQGGTELVYRALPTPATRVVTQDTLDRAVGIIRARLTALGARFRVRVAGMRVVLDLPRGVSTRIVRLAGATDNLEFYDWEANALAPNGKTVANQLLAQNPQALTISQGGSSGAGSPGAGSMSLYDAVKLASKQSAQMSRDNARLGRQLYLFGAPGSAACAAAAKAHGTEPVPGVHCLLSGPDENRSDLKSGLPTAVSTAAGQELVVPPGTVVLQAADADPNNQTPFDSPTAQFYVLKDHVSLSGNEITNPQQSKDPSGQADVTFYFTPRGRGAFRDVTRTIAQRGGINSASIEQLNQHFAVALDDKLITVPQIDSRQYPDGIVADQGADITGGFTIQSAQQLATELRLGALPVALELVSRKQIS